MHAIIVCFVAGIDGAGMNIAAVWRSRAPTTGSVSPTTVWITDFITVAEDTIWTETFYYLVQAGRLPLGATVLGAVETVIAIASTSGDAAVGAGFRMVGIANFIDGTILTVVAIQVIRRSAAYAFQAPVVVRAIESIHADRHIRYGLGEA